MTDLTAVLPDFPTQNFVRLLPKLEKNLVTTADLLTLDHGEIAKRAQLPLLDVKRLCNAALAALQASLGISGHDEAYAKTTLRKSGKEILNWGNTISTLDDDLDRALGGGIPTGCITEVTGESGAGKTQFLLTLLLSAQLPFPRGVSSSTLYISTESAIPTIRLAQMLRTRTALQHCDPKPSLDAVISIVTPDLESQDHILRFQVPVAIRQYGIRLIVLDSVAANYRAEFDRTGGGPTGGNMAQRSADLVKLGQLLRELAREHNIAVVVANQVADRFQGVGGSNSGSSPLAMRASQSSPLAYRGGPPRSSLRDEGPASSLPHPNGEYALTFRSTPDPMSLDHQQRWFTGWGDDPNPSFIASQSAKTPSLGLIWTNQIQCRIALIKRPMYGSRHVADQEREEGEPTLRMWRRYMKVVFAVNAQPSEPGLSDSVEFEIRREGLVAVRKKHEKDNEVV